MRYLFEEYAFDTDRRELHRGDSLIAIAPQVFDLLDYLIRNRDRVVSKDDLVNAVWKGRIVSDAALTTRLNAARIAIGDSGEEQRLIKTLPRKGVRFIGTVAESEKREPMGPGSRPGPEAPTLALPDRPSIAVLPFENMSGDPEQQYFADGMTEEITTALSRFKSLFVIGRNTSFTYKGRVVSAKQVGRELGVRYVLEGSVRKAGSKVRITGQLLEAVTDRHLWADHFDGALEDVFGLQDQITAKVVGLIAPKLEQAEIERSRRKPTEKLDSYDFFLRGMALGTSRRAQPLARAFFKEAFERDEEYAAAFAMAAWTFLVQQVTSGLPLTEEMRADAVQFARLGARAANFDAFTLARCGHVLTYFGQEYDRGLLMVEQAVALNPNLAIAWYSRGWVALMCGEPERAIESFDRMIRLSPFDPLRATAWLGISFAHFCQGRFEEGCALAVKAFQFTADTNMLEAYIANSVRAGHAVEAREAAAQLLKLQPDYHASRGRQAVPFRSNDVRKQIASALRAAGLPE